MLKIGIIGAGISGLVTAKTLKEHGFEVVVFEKETEVGGVWAASRRYPGITTQNTRDTYTFSDFPMPKHYPEWPSGEQVQAYLSNYAEHFGLVPSIRFGTQVLNAEHLSNGQGWRVFTESGGKLSEERVDFLTVCNGIFSQPNIPRVPGRELFEGKVFHSTEFHDEHLDGVRGKRVVVVGFAKSAHDILSQVGNVTERPVCVFREAKWKMPRFIGGKLNFKYLLLHRFGESLFPYRHLLGIHKFLHGPLGRPVTNLITKGLGVSIAAQLKLRKSGLHPEKPIESIASCSIGLTSDNFYERAAAGKIQLEQGEITSFEANGVQLSNGNFVEADTVVFATGFRQTVSFLDPQISERIVNKEGLFQLYRNILSPDVPGLAFVGYNSSLFNPFTSELAAHWVAQHLKGQLNLPSIPDMKREIKTHLEWLVERAPRNHASGLCVIPFSFHHADELMRDMGLRTRRTWNVVKEWLLPFDPALYRGLSAELFAKYGPAKIAGPKLPEMVSEGAFEIA
jgi:cation diffusion facilitator CzcD-associated flavoprotein CzcO